MNELRIRFNVRGKATDRHDPEAVQHWLRDRLLEGPQPRRVGSKVPLRRLIRRMPPPQQHDPRFARRPGGRAPACDAGSEVPGRFERFVHPTRELFEELVAAGVARQFAALLALAGAAEGASEGWARVAGLGAFASALTSALAGDELLDEVLSAFRLRIDDVRGRNQSSRQLRTSLIASATATMFARALWRLK